MLLLACLLLLAGYTLLYAGVKGVAWSQPWQLIIGSAPNAPGSSVTGSVGGILPGDNSPGFHPPGSPNPTTVA